MRAERYGMQHIDFIHGENIPDIFERRYSHAAAGWVDDVFHGREEEVDKVSPLRSDSGLRMSAHRFIEQSEPLRGEANTIARNIYDEGVGLRIPLDARDYHLVVELLGDTCDQQVEFIINGRAVARCTLAACEARTCEFDVVLEQRELELMVVQASHRTCKAATWATVTLQSLTWEAREKLAAPDPRIFIAADSTVQTYFDYERPQSGWGEWLYWYLYEGHQAAISPDESSAVLQAQVFEGKGPTIYNKALGGRAFKTYSAEHRFERLLQQLCPNDVVLIAFGINDTSSTRPMRYADPEEFCRWIDRYVVSVVDRGAVPILVTTTPQYWALGTVRPRTKLDDYADLVRVYAQNHTSNLIDLRADVLSYLERIPDEAREAFFLRARPLQYASHPDGIRDSTHLSVFGARICAGFVADGLAHLVPWVHMTHASNDERTTTQCPVRELRALNVRNHIGLCVRLTWHVPLGPADYYVIEKTETATGFTYDRIVVIKPEFLDVPLPGQSCHVTYTVWAWRENICSEPEMVAITLPRDDDTLVDV